MKLIIATIALAVFCALLPAGCGCVDGWGGSTCFAAERHEPPGR